jgi:hypothetical protein
VGLSIDVRAIDSNNISDRIKLCWGNLWDWKNLEIVQQSQQWLEKANKLFAPTTFIAYINATPAGMMEFIPQKLMKVIGLCPMQGKSREGENRG